MRETSFIEQNKKKWQEFEEEISKPIQKVDKSSDLFVQITDDLSFARTFYPNRSVRVYLNSLAQGIFLRIYKGKTHLFKRFISFWTTELPYLMWQARFDLALSFFIFFLSFLIGILSSSMDIDFPRLILGDAYIEMTDFNISENDPMAVYKGSEEFGMFFRIAVNNIFVSFRVFLLGVFFSIGTIGILIYNGIMVGAFQYYFFEQGYFLDSFLTIWMHGTLEISAIIIAGCAGLTLGKGLVFPETYSRLLSFQMSARRGLKIMIGITPVFLLAAGIEGYLTRHTEIHYFLRALFIFSCFVFIVGYYVIYPWIIAKSLKKVDSKTTAIPPTNEKFIDFTKIKTAGEIFSDVFVIYRKYIGNVLITVLICSFIFCLWVVRLSSSPLSSIFNFESGFLFSAVSRIDQFFINSSVSFLPIPLILIFSSINLIVIQSILKEENNQTEAKPSKLTFINTIKILIPTCILYLIILSNQLFTSILILLFFPLIILWIFVSLRENLNLFSAFQRTILLLKSNYSKAFSLLLIIFCVSILFYSIIDTMIVWTNVDIISWNFNMSDEANAILISLLLIFISFSVILLLYALLMFGLGLLYYSLLEILEAPDLLDEVEQLGTQNYIRGLERE